MTDRVSSGSERLDAVLGGGLLPNSINIVMGLPGSGKTIMAQQYLFENASEDRPAVYLSTVSEPLEKILRYGQTLSFFDPNAIGSLRPNRAPAILAGAALLVVVGIIDDIRGMPALVKLFWQVVMSGCGGFSMPRK